MKLVYSPYKSKTSLSKPEINEVKIVLVNIFLDSWK